MSKSPTVSVILPVYNGERYLSTAIESLLAQSLDDFEVILVDDGSTDASPEISNSYARADARIKIIRSAENRGFAAALNTGLSCASGRFIARLDHDDIALPERLETQVGVLSSMEDVGIVGSTMIVIDGAGENVGYMWYPETSDQIRFGLCLENDIAHPAVMCQAQLFKDHDLQYDSSYPASEDYALWAAASKLTGLYNIRQPLVKYRIHGPQMSSRSAAMQRLAADRISEGLLRLFIPDVALVSLERHILSALYHFCLREQLPVSKLPDSLSGTELRLAAAPQFGSGIETSRYRRLLQDILRRFIEHYGSRDVGLLRLCSDGPAANLLKNGMLGK